MPNFIEETVNLVFNNFTGSRSEFYLPNQKFYIGFIGEVSVVIFRQGEFTVYYRKEGKLQLSKLTSTMNSEYQARLLQAGYTFCKQLHSIL